jgi:hypothetical protein
MLYRNTTRTILNATDTTEKTKSINSLALSLVMTASGPDYLYLGVKKPFTTRYFYFATPNTNPCTLTVEYWNGTAWTAVEDLIDQTHGFTQSGFISWTGSSNWNYKEQTPIVASSSVDPKLYLYWVRIRVSADLSASTSLQAILNLFCDDTLFQAMYPNIATSAYYPSGKTNFLEQYEAAKNMVVLRLKQKGEIKDETEILDITEVAAAAVHATAYILLNPIARDDVKRQAAADAKAALNDEIKNSVFTLDQNNNATLDDESGPAGGCTFLTR